VIGGRRPWDSHDRSVTASAMPAESDARAVSRDVNGRSTLGRDRPEPTSRPVVRPLDVVGVGVRLFGAGGVGRPLSVLGRARQPISAGGQAPTSAQR
jgi:hypothetical protein